MFRLHTHTLQNPYIHTPTHYKTHAYTHPCIKNPHIHTPTYYKTRTYTHPHITNKTHTYTQLHITNAIIAKSNY